MNTGDEAKLLCLASPISRWDEALPLGNGMTGVLMWGGDRLVKLSLDRGDLWDERRGGAERCPDWNRAALREIVAAGDGERLRRLDRVAAAIPATRLPAGRIEIALPAAANRFVLDLSTATGRLWLDDGRLGMECFCAAAGEGIYFRLPPDIPAKVRLVMPAYGSANPEKDSLASLGYPPGCLVETGRRLIGWDEILEGGVSQDATVMSWRGTRGGIEAARHGNRVVMVPCAYFYFVYYQTHDPARVERETVATGRPDDVPYVTVRRAYEFSPYEGLDGGQRQCILGVQGNIWREYMVDFRQVEHMLLPRLAALAEVAWSCDRRDFPDFSRRLFRLKELYDQEGYRYAPYFFNGTDTVPQ